MNLANVSIRRPVFATMLIAAFMVFGLISYKKVGVDLFPNVELPFVANMEKDGQARFRTPGRTRPRWSATLGIRSKRP